MASIFGTRGAKRIILYATIYVCAGSAFFLPLTMPVLRSTSDFSIYNTGWNGCSQFARRLYASGKEVFPLHTSFATIRSRPENSRTALVIIGPTRPFSPADSDFTARFARSGGLVIVANDFDQGNSILEGMKLKVRFSKEPVADICYARNPSIVTCYVVDRQNELTRNISSLFLNRPAALQGTLPNGSTVLARTSEMSWLDLNDDGLWQRDTEKRSSVPVLVEIPYGEGEVLLLSDPSVFLNDMIDRTGNQQLYENLLSYITARDITRIYIDEQHHILSNPVETFTVAIRRSPDYQRLLIVWLLITVILFVIHPRIRETGIRIFDGAISVVLWALSLGAHEKSEQGADPLEQCLIKHPDWDREILERISQASLDSS